MKKHFWIKTTIFAVFLMIIAGVAMANRCVPCKLNHYCIEGLRYECPASKPVTISTGGAALSDCLTCNERNGNTLNPVYDDNIDDCVSCYEADNSKPYWDGNACTVCPSGTTYNISNSTCESAVSVDGNGVKKLTRAINSCETGYIAITTAEELAKIGVDSNYPLTGNYCLINDISLSVYSNWNPIGTSSNKFSGIFDGNGRVISDLTSVLNGLFMYSSGTVRNTNVAGSINSTTTGGSFGGLVVYNSGLIENSSADFDINVKLDVYDHSICYSVSCRIYAGGLCGYNTGTIKNSYSAGTVYGEIYDPYGNGGMNYVYIGGLVAENSGAIENSFSTASVDAVADYGSPRAGGLVAVLYEGSIANSYVISPHVYSSNSYTEGGFVGYIESNSATITHSYAASKMTSDGASSFVGAAYYASESAITESYSAGNLNPNITVNVCADTISGAEQKTVAELQVAKSSENLYANWSDDIWCFNGGRYPVLKNMPAGAPNATSCGIIETGCPISATGTYPNCNCELLIGTENYNVDTNSCVSCTYANEETPVWDVIEATCSTCAAIDEANPAWNGSTCTTCEKADSTLPIWDGTACVPDCPEGTTSNGKNCVLNEAVNECEAGYIAIFNANELAKIGNDENWPVSGKYCLMNDISLASYGASYNDGKGWNPIGKSGGSYPYTDAFSGVFDGNGHKITDLYINRPNHSYQGLFGYTYGGIIRNIGVIGTVTGGGNTGALAGEIFGSTKVINSYANATVTGSSQTGGLIGYAANSTSVTNSYSLGSVTSSSGYVGGLVGEIINGATLTNTYSHATVNATGTSGYAGGLVGESYTNAGVPVIKNSYATGSVTGGKYSGGLVGYIYKDTKILNSYTTSSVTTSLDTAYAGGLVGYITATATITNTYATGKVSGTSSYAGGFIGYNTAASISAYNYFATDKTGQTNPCGYGNCFNVTGVTSSNLLGTNLDIFKNWSTSDWCSSNFILC